MCNVIPAQSIEKEINGICSKKVSNGRTYTGYNVWSEENFQLFETISDGKYLIRGFTNKEIRHAICKQNKDSMQERGRMSRTLAKLRAHGLIRKIPHSRRYLVIDKGCRIIGALIETINTSFLPHLPFMTGRILVPADSLCSFIFMSW